MAVTLQTAIDEAQRHCSRDEWVMMSPAEQTRIIYIEMRRLDLEAAASETPCAMPTSDSTRIPTRAVAPPAKREEIRCQAAVRTRQSGQCAWKATAVINGVPYCGFHARLEATHRVRTSVPEAVD